MAILGIPMLLGPIGGPILGGWLIDNAHWLGRPSWTWIFLINLPMGVLGMIMTLKVMPNQTEPTVKPFDLSGFILFTRGGAG